jgi:hypothetical protein
MKEPGICDSDVLLLMDGRMLRVMEMRENGLNAVQFLDGDEESYIAFGKIHIEGNLGQNDYIIASFYTSRGIHLCLNRMNKV